MRCLLLCLLGVLLIAPASASDQSTSLHARVAVESVTVVRPTVIGFFPPVTQAEVDTDEAWGSALSHVEFALEDARKCLPHDSVDIHLAFATTLVVLWPDSISSAPTTFRFGSDSSYWRSACGSWPHIQSDLPHSRPKRPDSHAGPSCRGVLSEASVRPISRIDVSHPDV